MPVFSFMSEPRLKALGLTNYWGYNPINFFSPECRYAQYDAVNEFKTMVKELHAAGIEVILDVVYNHTAESGTDGPVMSLKGFDNRHYYTFEKQADKQSMNYLSHSNHSGCGNTVNNGNPWTLKLCLDSLRYWITEMQVDGFRFDLAVTLAREPNGFDEQSAFFKAVLQDPVISQVKLIAEPWDIGPGGYLRRDNGLTGAVNNKTFTGVFYIDASKSDISTNTSEYVIYHDNAIMVLFNNGYFQIILMNASGTEIAKATASPIMAGNRNIKLIFMISVDLSDTGKRYLRYQGLYNGSSYVGTGVTWNTYSNDNINHASSELLSLAHYGGTDFNLGIMYMANSYIDFSQEANRNKFVDQLGYPKDLTKQIEDGDIATPLVYMKFDPASLGTNSGSGGNFGVHNSPKAGADVNPYT